MYLYATHLVQIFQCYACCPPWPPWQLIRRIGTECRARNVPWLIGYFIHQKYASSVNFCRECRLKWRAIAGTHYLLRVFAINGASSIVVPCIETGTISMRTDSMSQIRESNDSYSLSIESRLCTRDVLFISRSKKFVEIKQNSISIVCVCLMPRPTRDRSDRRCSFIRSECVAVLHGSSNIHMCKVTTSG